MAVELDTPDALEYKFYPVSAGSFNFKVRASNDAHIALTSGPGESDPMVEIFIGGWSNQKSIIRKNRTKPERAEANTPNVLNAGEFRGFWIRWVDGIYTVGNEGEAAAFLSFQDNEQFPIAFAGVCTGWGATGSWIIEVKRQGHGYGYGGGAPVVAAAGFGGGWSAPPTQGGMGGGSVCWVPSGNGQVPPGAVAGGQDGSDTLFVARARHEGALIPGKLVPSHGVVYIPWGGAEHAFTDYDVLCGGPAQWVFASNGQVPPTAIPAGESEEGEPLFVGRCMHEGTVTIGKIQPSHSCCYIAFGGSEVPYPEYEVLTN